ncbi:uncharacterized protein [Rutidosis leptorrhynchoides]|uniref:uncharacterized protein n=1 Tax=Rutidosis leptorrhynchoides TaxID=125765 RepID=UPI003A9A5E35
MGLHIRSLAMLVILVRWPMIEAQTRARALDVLLQDYTFRAIDRPKTGIPYDASPPSNLTGIQLSALRLRSGSLFTRGVHMYKEFAIPIGVIGYPYVERLVLVYQDLANWSTTYYSLPGYLYLAPILGLLAYNASSLSAKNLQELEIHASEEPISIEFTQVQPVPAGLVARCVRFTLTGQIHFTNVESGNKCETYEQGHFSIVVESTTPLPAPVQQPPPPPPRHQGGGNGSGVIIVGSVVGGVALLVLLALLCE